MTSLQYLDLRGNAFVGSIPAGFGNLTGLTLLNTASNSLNSTVPTTLQQLSSLVYVICGFSVTCSVESARQLGEEPILLEDGIITLKQ